jgi:hypothetical protein
LAGGNGDARQLIFGRQRWRKVGEQWGYAALIGVHFGGNFYEFVPWNGTVEWEVAQWGFDEFGCLRLGSNPVVNDSQHVVKGVVNWSTDGLKADWMSWLNSGSGKGL